METGTRLERELYRSQAFMALSGVAVKVLIFILAKRRYTRVKVKREKKYMCVNGDDLRLSYREAAREHGITFPRFSRAIDDLLAKGFITIKHRGGGFNKDISVYGISNEYLKWRPDMVIEKREPEPVKRGWRRPKAARTLLKAVDG